MQNYKRFWALLPVALFTFSVSVQGAKFDPANPPEGVFFDQYYSLYLGKTKCGWAWYGLERKKDKITTKNKVHIEMGRENLVIQVNATGETTETVDGMPLTFQAEMELAGNKTIYRGSFNKNLVTMQITQGGQTVSHKFAAPADTVMAWGDFRIACKYLKQPGAVYTTHTFDPQAGPGKIGATQVTVAGPASATVAGKTVTGIKTISKNEDLGPFPITSIFDPQGYMLATDMQVGILKLQLVTSSKKEALANIKVEEIFSNSFVKLTRPLNLRPGRNLRLAITAIGKEPLPEMPGTSMQKVVARRPGGVVLEIAAPGTRRFAAKLAKPTAASLGSSIYVKLDDPLLIKLANQAAGSVRTPAAVAENLCRFVHTYIADKNLATAFASASETARAKSGDCSEHAVLLAALARIKKIPSQVVSGLAFVDEGGPHGSFGYHMWTQLWLNNQWIDMDPTFGQTAPDQTHIALAVQDLADETFSKQSIKFAQFIGQLRIEPAGK
jgi:hypothetical protein